MGMYTRISSTLASTATRLLVGFGKGLNCNFENYLLKALH